jgi:putative ABC transport system permease protein
MNFLTLVFKQMRQRALSTWLTLLSVALAVAMAIAVMILMRGGASLFAQSDFGYDLIVGAKGSPLQLTLNTVYNIDRAPGTIPYSFYERLLSGAPIHVAVPVAVGDNYRGHRIIATSTRMFGIDENGAPAEGKKVFTYRRDVPYRLAEGRVFHPRKFEAIVGSKIPELTGLKIGDSFQATHGLADTTRADVHAEAWEVVGVLERTGTAADEAIYIPLITFYCSDEHGEGLEDINRIRRLATQAPEPAPATQRESAEHAHDDHDHDDAHDDHGELMDEDHADHAEGEAGHDHHKHYTLAPDGTIDLHIPPDQWLISAVLVKTLAPTMTQTMLYTINNGPDAQAVNPAQVMRDFFMVFLAPAGMLLKLVSYLVTVVAGVSILVSIYNSVAARRREVAILRALGATRGRVLGLICAEAALVGLLGGLVGLVAGHALGAAGSAFVSRFLGQGFNWLLIGGEEWIYLAGVVVLSALAGLAPAVLAYRTPVAANLVS